MKKITLAAVLLICLGAIGNVAQAQDRMEEFMTETTPEERAQMQTDQMKSSLTLTEDQVPKIEAINLKYARKMQDAYASGGGKFQRLKKMKGVSQEKDKELKGVLTPGQYATYEKNKEAMKEQLRARAKERRGNR